MRDMVRESSVDALSTTSRWASCADGQGARRECNGRELISFAAQEAVCFAAYSERKRSCGLEIFVRITSRGVYISSR